MARVTSTYLLKLVSRSFAACIPLLDKNKKKEVENQYLLARFLDTIEDCTASIDKKILLMSIFNNILEHEKLEQLEYIKNFLLKNETVSTHDKVLVENIEGVINVFYSFDKKIKIMSIHHLKEMGYGMIKYQSKVVNTFEELDDYCYYVASTVGLYLTNLVAITDNLYLNKNDGIAFGRLLQKINILKDAKLDLVDNRFFLPTSIFENDNPSPYFNDESYIDKAMEILPTIIDNIQKEIEPTIKYIKSINTKAKGYRKFCTVAAIMACETLKCMNGRKEIFMGSPTKIKRSEVIKIILKTKMSYYTDEALDKYKESIIK